MSGGRRRLPSALELGLDQPTFWKHSLPYKISPSAVPSGNATSIWGLPIPRPTVAGTVLGFDGVNLVWVPSSTPIQTIYDCSPSESVNDPVYLSGVLTVSKADAADRSKMPVIGFIAAKLSPTTCTLQSENEMDGFIGLIPQQRYWIAVGGGISATLPPSDGSSVEQEAGIAVSSTILNIMLGMSPEQNV